MTDKYRDRREAADYLTAKGFKTSWRTLGKFASIGGESNTRDKPMTSPLDFDACSSIYLVAFGDAALISSSSNVFVERGFQFFCVGV